MLIVMVGARRDLFFVLDYAKTVTSFTLSVNMRIVTLLGARFVASSAFGIRMRRVSFE
jgi:hypothetical protein